MGSSFNRSLKINILIHKCQSHCLFEHASDWLVPQLHERGLEAAAVLQRGDAPSHHSCPVWEFFNNSFSEQWIRCEFDDRVCPLILELTTCKKNYKVCHIVKEKISQPWLTTIKNLKASQTDSQVPPWKTMPWTWEIIIICAERRESIETDSNKLT